MIDCPKGISLYFNEFAVFEPIEADANRQRLRCPRTLTPVPLGAEVIVRHEPEAKFKAVCFIATLKDAGYRNLILEQTHEVEYGNLVA